MTKRYFLKCFVIVIFICFGAKVSFSASLDGILESNKYIDLGDKKQQIVKLNVRRDGLYAIKSLGPNDIIMDLVNKNDEEVKPNFVGYDGNVFAMYLLKSGSYYANIRIKIEDNNERSKLGLYYLNDTALIEGTSFESKINNCNQGEYYRYIPKDDDMYMIRSTGRLNLNASIYDEAGTKIQDSSNVSGLNFKMLEELKKGKCYYIRVWSVNDVGNFKLEVSKKRLRNKEIIDLELDDNLDEDFCGYIKDGESNIKFISNVDGEYRFILISEMNLAIDVKDENKKSVVKYCECNKKYAFAMVDVERGKEYVINISGDLDKMGMYKLKIFNFYKLRKYAKDVLVGKNKGFILSGDEYLRFVCPLDGVFNFENIGVHDISIDFYDENGKLLKKAEKNPGVLKDVFGIRANKGDILYLKISNICCNLLEFDYEIEINNFGDLIKNCDVASMGDMSGYIEKVDQNCFYKFVPRKNGTYFIKSNCNKFLNCRLYNEDGHLMQEDLKNLDFIVAAKLEKGETYYINISSANNIGEFQFEILLVDDMQKIRIQEDMELCNEIEYLGEVKQYEFYASEDAVYLPKVESSARVDIIKRDENGNVIENMNLKKGEKRIIEVDSLTDVGSYCLKIENFTNKMRNATKVICGNEYQGNIIVPGMENVYSFVPEVSGYYSICAFSDLRVVSKVYNSNGDLLVESKKEDDLNFYVVAKLEKGETYLITINEETGKESCIYSLAIDQNEKCQTDPNWIKLNKTKFGLLGYDGAESVYKIIIPKNGKYFINNYLSIELDMEVINENGEVIQKLNDGNVSNRNLYEFKGNSLYYIKLKSKDGIATGMYSLKVENLEMVYKDARLLVQNTLEKIKKTKKEESSYYRFIVDYKDIYNISKIQGDRLYIDLLDHEGMVVVSGVLDNNINIKLDRGTYYLRCFSSSDSDIVIFSKSGDI